MWASTDDPWGAPLNLGTTVNSSADDLSPDISADGLSLFFDSRRSGGYGDRDLWVTTRASTNENWVTPVNLGVTVNSSATDACPHISPDGLSLFFASGRPGGYGDKDLWITTRASLDDEWDTPVNLGAIVNSSALDCCPSISVDGRTLFFHSTRPGGYGGRDLWVTTRPTTRDPWAEPMNLGLTVNSSAYDVGPSVSADGRTLYFYSNRPGGSGNHDLWQASIIPIVDFDGDGNIDTDDLLILIDNWDTDESLCDIGPMPWGDGVVDIEDLKVFMSYWEQENMPEIPDDDE